MRPGEAEPGGVEPDKGGVWYKMKLNQVVCNRVELHLNLMWCGIQIKLNQVFIREKV